MSKYNTLNKMQYEAVVHTEGPLLLLAGAGSGKTRVLTHRIAYLIEEKGVRPYNIMAITFTNKAAKEMRERVDNLVEEDGRSVWVSTFHSSCVRILRQHIEELDPSYERSFTIYDTDDSKKLVRECIKELQIDPKQFKERAALSEISSAKNELLTPKKYENKFLGDYRKSKYAEIYKLYEKKLKSNNALDFGDLLFKTVQLFDRRPDILENYQKKFQYIMVDEYQDTNTVQFALVSMLAAKHKNLCVVGDDDQSIYKFRGADIKNILNFENLFVGARVIRLEQNYRSTSNIIAAANGVIKNNRKRKHKKLWTEQEDGAAISFSQVQNEKMESAFIASEIMEIVNENQASYKDIAILYRTNMQSRVLEEKLVYENIPYKILGGVSFYQRKEIKDILAYLKIVNNGADDLAVKRIINVPRRGIGNTTVERLTQYGLEMGISFFESVSDVDNIPSCKNARKKVNAFSDLITNCQEIAREESLVELVDYVLTQTGYRQELILEGTDEAKDRLANLGELVTKITEYERNAEEPTLNEFLEEVSLIADVDSYEEDADYVVLMTLHSAKGLEFPYVFMAGLEDGLFPSYMSINSGEEDDIEEERRLCYVGITRAMKKLYITAAKSRMVQGQTMYAKISRFIGEIPGELIDVEEDVIGGSSGFDGFGSSSSFAGSGGGYRSSNHSGENSSRFASNTSGYKQRSADSTSNRNTYGGRGFGELKARKKVYDNPYKTKQALPSNKEEKLEYTTGDLVKHPQYGMGVVQKIEPGGAGHQVTVNFPSAGIKKLMSTFANLKKC